jgi:beta-1,4-mannosyl-glycoprotein beta-1,4-N-acetylglucosaminyltransferase
MVYDCFTFFNEHNILDIRLNTLYDHVDKFILVEATRSHQNLPKPLYFDENKNKYSKFLDKIIHVVIDTYPEHTYFSFEEHQRDQIYTELKNIANDQDVIFFSDADEIWNPNVIDTINLEHGKLYSWASYICYHYFNLVAQKEYWYQPKYCLFSTLKEYCGNQNLKLTHDVLRNKNSIIKNNDIILQDYLGGWHFSYTEDVEYKLQNFLHSEYRNMKYDHFINLIKNGVNPFHGNEVFIIDDLQNYLPNYVLDNIDKFKKFILQQ